LFNNQQSFFNPQFSIHLREALAQRTFAIAAKLDLITTSFGGQELWLLGWSVKRESAERDRCSDALALYPATAGLHALDARRRQFVGITPKAPKLFLYEP
jgi:hypothetical protein